MITKIVGEQPFQVLTSNFSISPSNEGYTLQISADGKNFSNLFTVGAGVTRLVTDVAANSYYRLLGNQSEVSVNWIKVCVTEGGSGGSGTTYTAGAYIDLTGDVISVTGITPDEYLTSADTANFALSADVATLSAATAGKADKANVSAISSGYHIPRWNAEGVITGETGQLYSKYFSINGINTAGFMSNYDYNFGPIFTPTTPGTAGDILVSTGGTPVWSAATFAQQSDLNTLSAATESAIATIPENPVQSLSIDTIWKGTAAEYDLITTKDPNTFYIIVSN